VLHEPDSSCATLRALDRYQRCLLATVATATGVIAAVAVVAIAVAGAVAEEAEEEAEGTIREEAAMAFRTPITLVAA
jgi:hypothetical protein